MAYSRWWPQWWRLKEDDQLSVLDVVSSGTLDYKLAGLLWLLIERRASVLVAAGPSFVGKSTLLHALLDFLPPGIERIDLRGYMEDFRFTAAGGADRTYLVTEEISNHSYDYLWGHQVVKALALIPKGYALGGTIHARNIREVAYVLNAIGVPLSLIAGLGLVITLQAKRGRAYDDDIVRYVDTVNIVSLGKEGLTAHTLASRQSADDEFVYPPEPALRSILFQKFGFNYDDLSSEIELRAKFLSRLHDNGISSREEVKKSLSEYSRE